MCSGIAWDSEGLADVDVALIGPFVDLRVLTRDTSYMMTFYLQKAECLYRYL